MPKWSNWRWPFVALVLLVLLAGIFGGAAKLRSHRGRSWLPIPATTPPVPVPKPRPDPDPNVSARPLGFEPLPAAQELYRQVANEPYSAEPRRQLAEEYRKAGYPAVSEFFSFTAEFLDGSPIRQFVGPKEPWYKCLAVSEHADLEHSPDLKVASHMAKDLVALPPRIFEAVEQGRRYLEDEGWSCPVALQWAMSMMHVPLTTHEDWASREMALRFLITAIEEAGERPGGYVAQTDSICWWLLVIYFDRMKDVPSAFVAQTLHQRSLAQEPLCREEDCLHGPQGQEITRRLESYKKKIAQRWH